MYLLAMADAEELCDAAVAPSYTTQYLLMHSVDAMCKESIEHWLTSK